MESECANQTIDRPRFGLPATLVRRVRGAAVAVAALGVILVFGVLHPDPSGMGTHQQWKLPTCSFLARTGWPCPTCGMTTSLAAMVRGNVVLAFRAHPFGVVVFIVLVAAVLVGGWELLSGRSMFTRLRPRMWWALAAGGMLLGGWMIKIAIGIARGELPI